ncbi:MAG TPA: lycopene cyclase domain-containing protein [Acidimicrobiales bacterium]|nr:lycopene cyclase domain-containing protein [Acidimicrobiales bacterium]
MWAFVAAAAVVVLELLVVRSGILATLRFWVTIAIAFGFQVLVDGWLTKLTAPVVIYNSNEHHLPRFPWDIPMEDFVYGWALMTLVLMIWARTTRPAPEGAR